MYFENHQYFSHGSYGKAFVLSLVCFTLFRFLIQPFPSQTNKKRQKKMSEEDRFDLKSTSHEIAHMTNRKRMNEIKQKTKRITLDPSFKNMKS